MRLTKSQIDGFSYGGDGKSRDVRWDEKVPGLGVRIYPSGRKAFVLSYRAHGAKRLLTLGDYGTLTLETARKKAQQERAKVLEGQDPLQERRQTRAAPTVADLAKDYLERHARPHKRASSVADDVDMLSQKVLPALGTKKVATVSRRDIESLHQSLKGTPYRANRVLALLSKMFSLAIHWGWRPDNPVIGIPRFPEEKRERWLNEEELAKLLEVLSTHSNQRAANAVRLLVLTGSRRSEVLSATWEQFDLSREVWTKPSHQTKQNKTEHVPRNKAALQLLTVMRLADPAGSYLFPGDRAGKPLQDIKGFWSSVCATAGLNNVRIHDLRHTFASHLVSSGLSLEIVGRLLGHSQAATTKRYAHLADHPLREATNRFATIVASTKGGR
jgi:integrase